LKQEKSKYLSEKTINKLGGFSLGYLTEAQFNELLNKLEEEIEKLPFTAGAEANLGRIIEAHFDKANFLLDCLKYPHYIELLTVISVHSNYLTDILILNPEYFYWAANPVELNMNMDNDYFESNLNKTLLQFRTFEARVNAIRRFKRKEILRIGLNDLLGNISLQEVTRRLSLLAKAIASQLFILCYKEIEAKHKVKLPEEGYCIVSLGKMGGGELNYSSDIDLVIFYDKERELGKKLYSELLTEAIFLFIEKATAITGTGFIYRVDFRLRPDGRASHLTRSLHDYLNYYEWRGEDWERQMLIKTGYAGGSYKLYSDFVSYLQPFIYPSTFTIPPTEQIKQLKKNIEQNLTSDSNIKLVPGGIRDIEFSLQALQLLNGGRLKEIRTGNSLTAIEKLREFKLLSAPEAKTLTTAYILYRRMEHYLQLMNDKQTHDIPLQGELLEKLSAFLNFNNSVDLIKEIQQLRKKVSDIFHSIMGSDFDTPISPLESVKLKNRKKGEQDLLYLSEGKGVIGEKKFDTITIDLFLQIRNTLINELRKSADPDLILSSFSRVIRNAGFPSIWYKQFMNKKLFLNFIRILESQRSLDLFAEDKLLRDRLLSGKVFDKINLNEEFNYKELLFTLSVQLNLNMINEDKATSLLGSFFVTRIKKLAEEVVTVYDENDYIVAAMGSLGTGEPTFASDIDLIFCVRELNSSINNDSVFQKLLKRIKEEFPGREIDCRLRPEGKNNVLVTDLKGYKNYIDSRARIWEFQSFTKMSLISGGVSLFNLLRKEFVNKLKTFEGEKIKREVVEMRNKLTGGSNFTGVINLKKAGGGKTDLDFIIQYLLLINPDLIRRASGKNNLKRIDLLSKIYPGNNDFIKLKESILFLKKIELNIQNLFNTGTAIIPVEDERLSLLAGRLKMKSGAELKEKITAALRTNYQLFHKYLK
jgi:[glutamine synthetase] adenylyltransferase / [glutamine synthetase]-adenylyl-L-tyrosine phosphorylase